MNEHENTEELPSSPPHNDTASGTQESFLAFLRCPPNLRNNICEICIEIQSRIHRSITIRGLPRLFLLRRFFCLYWIIVVTVLIYLKLYFPLYLTSTVNRNTLEEFRQDWCRVRRSRTDWKGILSPCLENTKWGEYPTGWTLENRTDPDASYISLMNINPAGEFSRFSIQSQTPDGRLKTSGGDAWRIYIKGPSALAPTVIDHGNGTYEILFLVLEAGEYRISVVMDYTLCNGLRNPPDDWFMSGNIHGSNQAHGILGNERHYSKQPLWQGTPLIIVVPHAPGPLRKDEFLSYGFGDPINCGEGCNLLWDGFGRWTNDTWAPYVSDTQLRSSSPRRKQGILWIYGDSVAVRLYKSIKRTRLCTRIFTRCNYTYNWIYEVHNPNLEKRMKTFQDINQRKVLQELRNVLHRGDMDENSVVVLNFGLHFVSSTNFSNYKRLIDNVIEVLRETSEDESGELRLFRGEIIWKSTTAINREKLFNPYHHSRRFMTMQRILLFNAYAAWAMCRAGHKVLDVYPISDSYPGGTDTRYDAHDSVHFKESVFEPAQQLLERYYGDIVGIEDTL